MLCSEYKVYDLESYEPLYSLSDVNVQEVKISPGIMLVIHNSKETVPLKILNIEDGSVLKVRLDMAFVTPTLSTFSTHKHHAGLYPLSWLQRCIVLLSLGTAPCAYSS